jgi:hypothetical protein
MLEQTTNAITTVSKSSNVTDSWTNWGIAEKAFLSAGQQFF